MRLATIRHEGADKVVAALDEERALDVSNVAPSMQALIEAGPAALDRVREALAAPDDDAVIALADATFRAPLPVPAQIRDCLVFEEHLLNSFEQASKMTGREFAIPPVWYDQPIYYKANRFSVIGHDETVRWPLYSDHMDFECELAIVIGRGGADIPAASAADHIFGYTIFNDMSARDAQMVEMAGQLGPAKGKDFDTGNVFGPWILTADEVEHPIALAMEARVNGERWGGGNSQAMHHSFADIIAHVSASETLHPGEVIGSGTVGTGCGLEIGRKLADGDVIELEIERIGTLRNRIVKGETA